VIVNGYIDDSADEAVFVLAGYVAPAEEWAKFSDEWAATLKAPPSIAYLKTKEAMGSRGKKPNGEFHRWTENQRDAKLNALYRVIDKYVSFEVSAVIHLGPFRRIFGNGVLPKAAANPYYHAISGLISGVAREQIRQGMPEKIDFVFDEQLMEQGRFLAIWDDLARTAPPDVKPMIGSTPIFRKDSGEDAVLPLQAADLEAWWLRQRWREKLTGEPEIPYPWQPAAIPGVSNVFDEAELKICYEKIFQAHWDLGWRPG